MKTTKNVVAKIATVILAGMMVMALASCNEKGGSAKPNAESDFEFEVLKNGLGIKIENYKGKSTKVVIPAEIQGVPVVSLSTYSSGFRDAKVTSVVIPEGVVAICKDSFEGVSTLKSVSIPSTVQYIGEDAFYKTGITSLSLPTGLKYVGRNAFTGCKELETIENLDTLESVYIWDGVQAWNSSPIEPLFQNCDKLNASAAMQQKLKSIKSKDGGFSSKNEVAKEIKAFEGKYVWGK